MKNILFIILFAYSPVFSQTIKISSAVFQYTPSVVAKKKVYSYCDSIKLKPEGKLENYYRLEITVKNFSQKAAEGLLLKYSLRLFLKKGDKIYKDVSYLSEDIRISRLSAGEEKKIYVYNTDLSEQIRRLKNSGFEPAFLELEIAKEARKGDEALDLSFYSFPFSK